MSKYAELFKSSPEAGRQADTVAPDSSGAVVAPELSDAGQNRYTILFVDDEERILKALARIFLDENYEILTAANGSEALEIMSAKRVHLVVSDHRMPGMTGAEFLRHVKERWPETIRIMLTGYADVQSIMGAVNEGAVYKFITKPWNDEDLRLTVSLALQQYALLQENRKLREITKKQEQKIKGYSALFNENRGMLGSILVKAGVIDDAALKRAEKERQKDEFISETLGRLGLATEQTIVKTLQKSLNVPHIDLREVGITAAVVRFLPRDICERNRLMPIKFDGRQITIAMADPSDIIKCDNIQMMTGFRVIPVIAGSSEIMARLAQVYGDDKKGGAEEEPESIFENEPMDEIDIVIEEEEDVDVEELLSSSDVPPIVRIVNAIISEAVRYRASDVHIEPKTKYTVIRYRIDGLLHSKIKIPAELHAAAISRIKILAKLDIAERRKPQDGRITVKAGTGMVDIRVSTLPTITGEKIVMRILDKSAAIRQLDELGVLPSDKKIIAKLIKKPQGIIVATGPTGSGKTTMLYSILNEMLQSTKNFETIEDPVEYHLDDANQVFVQTKIGLSFASVLRSTLRQDPDVILVGEIRDPETADVSFKAALTGHVVLTTLHTNNAVASVTRLMNMGVEPYLIASALEGVLAQRLVRKICRYCREETSPDPDVLELLNVRPEALGSTVYTGRGCDRCGGTGYQGRLGIFEIFLMNEDFRHFISGDYREAKLVDMARAGGMKTLIEDGLEKVRLGMTTLDELVRVIGAQTRHERKCDRCDRMVDAKFLFCPFCGEFKRNYCRRCMVLLDEEWTNCPFCGTIKGALEVETD